MFVVVHVIYQVLKEARKASNKTTDLLQNNAQILKYIHQHY